MPGSMNYGSWKCLRHSKDWIKFSVRSVVGETFISDNYHRIFFFEFIINFTNHQSCLFFRICLPDCIHYFSKHILRSSIWTISNTHACYLQFFLFWYSMVEKSQGSILYFLRICIERSMSFKSFKLWTIRLIIYLS